MKAEPEVEMISAGAPILFAKGCDIFITELTMRAWIHAEEHKRRVLQRSDIGNALAKSDMFDFLIDIVPREEKDSTIRTRQTVPKTHDELLGGYPPSLFEEVKTDWEESMGSKAWRTRSSLVSRAYRVSKILPLRGITASLLLRKTSALSVRTASRGSDLPDTVAEAGWALGAGIPELCGWPYAAVGVIKLIAVLALSKKFGKERTTGLATLVTDLVWIIIKEDAKTAPFVLWTTFIESCVFTLAFATLQFRKFQMGYGDAVAIVLSAAGLNLIATHNISSSRAGSMPSPALHLLPCLGISVLYWSYHASLAPRFSGSQRGILPQ